MSKVRVPIANTPTKVVTIESDATIGATFGVNLRYPNGTLVQASDFGAPPSNGGGTQPVVTIWRLILEIPPNVTALANTATAGLYVVTGAGTSATREIQGVMGRTTVSNGDGVAGDPVVDLAVVPNGGDGAFLLFYRDTYGRVVSTTPGDSDDVPEGATNLYFSDERAQDAVVVQTITNGDTTHAPSGDVVFDALALKANIPAGYIDGLPMQWVSGTALTVGSGSAYIPATGNIVPVPSAIAKAGLALAASTWYHVYLFLNAGTPDIEIVTTAPEIYSGTARHKTADSSRRFIGSIKTGGSGAIAKFVQDGALVKYQDQLTAYGASVMTAGTATVATNVSCAGPVPITATTALMNFSNTDAAIPVIANPDCNFVLSGLDWLFALSGNSRLSGLIPLSSTQQFNYRFLAATSGGGLTAIVIGYQYQR